MSDRSEDIFQQFNDIVKLNELTDIVVEDEIDVEFQDSEITAAELLETTYNLQALIQQLIAATIDQNNEDEVTWLDAEGSSFVRDLNDLCEAIIDRIFDSDCECGEDE